MSEATLKTAWCKTMTRLGFKTRRLGASGMSTPGMPDIFVADKGVGPPVVRDTLRAKGHWLEAKVAHLGPRTLNVFEARRDATSAQIEWNWEFRLMGLPSWWLILDDEGYYALLEGDQQTLSRDRYEVLKQTYRGRWAEPPMELLEETDEKYRALYIGDVERALEAMYKDLARLKLKKG